jgi:hypothetical protein
LNALQLAAPLEPRTKIERYLGGAWSMHLPFAWDLMKEFKPKVFVELGVYKGESYFCFCQSAHITLSSHGSKAGEPRPKDLTRAVDK